MRFWNVKLSLAPQKEDLSQPSIEAESESQSAGAEGGAEADPGSESGTRSGSESRVEKRPSETAGAEADSKAPVLDDGNGSTVDLLLPEESADAPIELKSPAELKLAQQQMEEKVYQIWTVLSAFEESSAGCISDMLLHVSNGAYYDGVQMAGRFILHVDILFSAIDDLEVQMKEVGDQSDMAHGREAKMLCKKIVNFFSLLSHTQESGVRRLGMTQELLSLVTGLAHYLKILIRIALTSALKLERQYDSPAVIARFLNKLMELANRDKYMSDLHGKQSMDAEVTSDLCLACRVTIEDECFTFNQNHRWHPKCLICAKCAKPQASVYYDASFDLGRGLVLCQQCKTPESQTGFSHVTKLEQYTFLLRVALIRLENLLHLKGDEQAAMDQRSRLLTASPTGPLSPPGLMRNDSRSKSYSSDDNRQYETIHLGDIKRVKSTHLDRKLSNSARIPRRQTVIERQRRQPAATGSILNELASADNAAMQSATVAEAAPLEIEIIEERHPDALQHDDEEDIEGPNPHAPATLSDLTERLRISATVNASPTASIRLRQSQGSAQGHPLLEVTNASSHPKRQYLSELSALELFIVKHLAVLTLAPVVSEYFTLEELLDLIGQRKQTLWGRFVKGLKTDKKKPKAEGTFGVPLEVLVERNGVDSALGAGPGRIRIPSFVDDSISAMRNMDMSVEGVFRKNGNIRRLKELSEAIDKDPSSVNLSDDNPVQVAALLKKFLRDLPDPLLTFKLHRLFVVSQKMEDEAIRRMILHLTCCLLPKPNRDSMEAICLFLRWVASFSHVDEETGSKMDLHNLATVITPNVLYSKSKDPTKDESFLAIEAVMGLLEYQDEFCVVPMDLSSILSDQDLVESSTDLSSKDILKRCENLVRSKIKKSHSLGDLYTDSNNGDSIGKLVASSSEAGVAGDISHHHPHPQHHNTQLHHAQQHHHHPNHHNHHHNHHHNTAAPSSSSATTSAIRIPERPKPYHHSHSSQAVTLGARDRERGSTPMSL
ncbi:rho-GTPase-activating protein [Dissophora ornata]|nr:rho-GTPase-activating protein [Dissophora ornata]